MKVNEIAFINSLEAQNRKMELLGKEQQAEAKRAEIQVRQKVIPTCHITCVCVLCILHVV